MTGQPDGVDGDGAFRAEIRCGHAVGELTVFGGRANALVPPHQPGLQHEEPVV